MQRLLVDQADITHTELDLATDTELLPGEARLHLQRCALTANNVTYAATGFAIGYWKFFPSGVAGKGLLPVWGFAQVLESRSDAVRPGDRVYGFFPMADTMVMTPRAEGENVVVDSAPHRADLPPVYNRYHRAGAEDAAAEGLQALLQPLLATSYLLCDWLQDNAYFDADQVVVGSASSKTGLGLCAFLAELHRRPVRIVGLTSAANTDFVEALGICDQIVSYEEVTRLDLVPSVFVDMAGNAKVKQRVHAHLGDFLRHSSAVGISHWDQFRPGLALDGPKPEFFFAPAQIEKRRADWGPGVIERRISEGWHRIAEGAHAWLELRTHAGLAAAADVYDQLAHGRADPRKGHIVTL